MKWRSAFSSQRGETVAMKAEHACCSPRRAFGAACTRRRPFLCSLVVFVVEKLLEMYRFYVLLVNNSQVRRACGVVTRQMGGNSFPHHKALKYFRIVFDCCSPQVDRGMLNYLPHENSLPRRGNRLHFAFRIDAFLFSAGLEDCVASTNTGQGDLLVPLAAVLSTTK